MFVQVHDNLVHPKVGHWSREHTVILRGARGGMPPTPLPTPNPSNVQKRGGGGGGGGRLAWLGAGAMLQ